MWATAAKRQEHRSGLLFYFGGTVQKRLSVGLWPFIWPPLLITIFFVQIEDNWLIIRYIICTNQCIKIPARLLTLYSLPSGIYTEFVHQLCITISTVIPVFRFKEFQPVIHGSATLESELLGCIILRTLGVSIEVCLYLSSFF